MLIVAMITAVANNAGTGITIRDQSSVALALEIRSGRQ